MARPIGLGLLWPILARPITGNVRAVIGLLLVQYVADRGGGVQGVRTPPLLGHDVGFLTLSWGPKLDPPPFFFACRPKMQWRILWMTSHGQCPRGVLVNVQERGSFSIF